MALPLFRLPRVLHHCPVSEGHVQRIVLVELPLSPVVSVDRAPAHSRLAQVSSLETFRHAFPRYVHDFSCLSSATLSDVAFRPDTCL